MFPPLLTSQDSLGHVHLIVGSNPLASARCAKSLEVGAHPKIIAPPNAEIHYVLAKRIEDGEVEWIKKDYKEEDLKRLGREDADNVVDAVFMTHGAKAPLSSQISNQCKRLRIPVNVSDAPNLCTFTLLSTHSDGPLQIGITTSGKGCKMASRIRREIASTLPPNFGQAVERLGTVRRRIWEEDHRAHQAEDVAPEIEDDDGTSQKPTFNQLVSESDHNAAKTRRLRWLSQICEYWPLRRLASITDADVDAILQSYTASASPALDTRQLDLRPRSPPKVILAGSGPGSTALLTLATHHAIRTASVILADKLVPAPVLELIPRRTPVHIARKFPGNADAAQEELLTMGLEALKNGHTVLRLKQGDPYLYGRGAEEYSFFSKHGFKPVVLPGVTSALSGPLFAGIPPTHRSVSDQVLICTGTGRKGAAPSPPPYLPKQTVVFLMALHRLTSLVDSLVGGDPLQSLSETKAQSEQGAKTSTHWPLQTPCAVIERASCPDQRVIRSSLQHVCAAVEEEGSRPPGLLVVGWSCEVLFKAGVGAKWLVEEGVERMDCDALGIGSGLPDINGMSMKGDAI